MRTVRTAFAALMWVFSSTGFLSAGAITEVYTGGNHIHDIAVDGDFLWCATYGGVVCWNVRDMTAVKYNENDGLPFNDSEAVFIDSLDVVWAKTGRGLAYFDGSDWSSDDSGANPPPDDTMFMDGNVRWKTVSGGVSVYIDGIWTDYTESDGLSNARVYDVDMDTSGRLWFGTYNGLSVFDGVSWTTYTTADGLADNYISTIMVEDSDDVWVGTRNEAVSRFDGVKWDTHVFPDAGKFSSPSDIVRGGDGALWVGLLRGLMRFDGESWEPVRFTDAPMIDKYDSVAVTPQGVVWVGSYGGVSRFDGVNWTSFTVNDGLAGETVLAIRVGTDGRIWFVTNGGLSMYDGVAWDSFFLNEGPARFSSLQLEIAPNGDVWYGTGAWLYHYDGESWKRYSTLDGLPSNSINAIAFAPDGTVWVAAFRVESLTGGVARYDGERWVSYYEEDGLANNYVTSLAVTPDGVVWAGTCAVAFSHDIKPPKPGGLSRFDDGTWTVVMPSSETSLIKYIACEDDGTLWFGRPSDMLHYDGNVWETHLYSGLFAMSPSEEMWIGEWGCLHRYSGTSWRTYRFSPESEDFHIIASTDVRSLGFGPSGDVWAGTANGLYRIVLDTVAVNDRPGIPSAFEVRGNYPNPFNPSTTIEYTVSEPGRYSLTIFNAIGQTVKTFEPRMISEGSYSVVWDGTTDGGKNVSSGIYIVRLGCGEKWATHCMTLTR